MLNFPTEAASLETKPFIATELRSPVCILEHIAFVLVFPFITEQEVCHRFSLSISNRQVFSSRWISKVNDQNHSTNREIMSRAHEWKLACSGKKGRVITRLWVMFYFSYASFIVHRQRRNLQILDFKTYTLYINLVCGLQFLTQKAFFLLVFYTVSFSFWFLNRENCKSGPATDIGYFIEGNPPDVLYRDPRNYLIIGN